MLVLTRKVDDAIMIGDDIELKVISIEKDQVKLGIAAPKHVSIHRKEIVVDIAKENQAAASISQELFSQITNRNE
ncbi:MULTISPECIES: carbon storage regulator CsrA [Geomicrobium]|uniref:Translational regulator CsrA n=1 Tax=Geomicrobium sediminis TaxID=1347788 RepID=A0ABS2P7L4_9BACL|nr:MULTISPECIES: carbon storage regulator CsrA [Geomicrobium]MBM7631277.1 carbon storage regulator [Geomicrobium sediminis]GAJ97534.1 carbon storage regulator [Geomicrobium sp. JCM 19055]GAK07221.1 carbon storage regulator [Geomicrobium sp. JCM 19038]